MTALRGATTVSANSAEEIENAAAELVGEIMEKNLLTEEKVCAIIFSCTKDLTAAYPAKGARERLGLVSTPMFCVQEQYVDGALERCVRALVLCEIDGKNARHIYLKGAINLRRDLKLD